MADSSTKLILNHYRKKYGFKRYIDTLLYLKNEYPKSHQKKHIKTIDINLIEDLLNEMYDITSVPLKKLNIDSIWLDNNAERLWENYYHKKGYNKRCIKCLKDYEKIYNASRSVLFGHSSNIIYCSIELINSKDTVLFSSRNSAPFMLPWLIEGGIPIYNPKISIIIAKLLPGYHHSLRKLLSGKDFDNNKSFEQLLSEELIKMYCGDIFSRTANKFSDPF